ncbi:hypothetical protein [Anabaena sp. UHCC 0399]|uniref:hypothetical protein n=1 Tax=Anabaena sp. UHCC 0399 TaxID=3110238 RepID=UPI0016821379|nr:hypothetical protein [Anabaena sp. UHCC 0399]MBD2361282.1 hypothetical protein [Anabaena minutissima FACHB-250]MEA5563908.1 hypothetical protein [Anabaena sp. UHCC 0399]
MKPTILVCSLFAAQIVFAPAFATTGSYTQSCRNIKTRAVPIARGREYFELAADCRNRRGQWVSTTLQNYHRCRPGTINNQDGRLVCQYR